MAARWRRIAGGVIRTGLEQTITQRNWQPPQPRRQPADTALYGRNGSHFLPPYRQKIIHGVIALDPARSAGEGSDKFCRSWEFRFMALSTTIGERVEDLFIIATADRRA